MATDTETPVLDLLEDDRRLDRGFDPRRQPLMLVRIAALVAMDAPPVSYPMNLGVASEIGITEEHVRGVLTAVAPIVGTARVAAATTNIVRALAFAIETAELDDERGRRCAHRDMR